MKVVTSFSTWPRTCEKPDSGRHSRKVYIGSIAKQAGLSVDTIRFYEKQRLFTPPPRTQAGYRLYGTEELRMLRFITGAQKLGFSLQEIRQLVNIRCCPVEVCEKTSGLI